MQNLTETQIAENLSLCFRPIFGDIRRQKVYADEKVVYAADFTSNANQVVKIWGFMVFTDRRYLQITATSESTMGASYYKSGSVWDKIMGRKADDRRWIDPYRSFTESYLAKLKLPDCWDFGYSSIKGFTRTDYSVEIGSDVIALVELHLEFHNRFGNFYETFKAKDGDYICELLTLATQNNGRLPVK